MVSRLPFRLFCFQLLLNLSFFKPHSLDQLLAPKQLLLKSRYPSLLLLDDVMKSTADNFDGSVLRQVNLGNAVGAVNQFSWYFFLLLPLFPCSPSVCFWQPSADVICFSLYQERAAWGCLGSPLRFRNCRSELNLSGVRGDVHSISLETWKYTESCNFFRTLCILQVRQSPIIGMSGPMLFSQLISERERWLHYRFHLNLIGMSMDKKMKSIQRLPDLYDCARIQIMNNGI